jgi:sugar lactone lactonase YvrE
MTHTTILRSLLAAVALAALQFGPTVLRAATGDILETNEGNVIRFSTSSATPSTFATALSNPKGIVFDGNGHLYVADPGKSAVLVFTLPDATGSTYVSGLSSPTGLAFDTAGSLYVSEAGTGNILKFTRDGMRTTFASNVGASAGLTFDASGNLFASDFTGGKINKFSPDGTQSTFATGLDHPAGLAIDSAGNIFEADSGTGTIFKFAPDGTKSSFVTGLSRPYGLAFEATGNLIVADNASGATLRYTPAAVKTVVFSSNFNTPQFVAVEPAQHQLLNISTRGFVQGGSDVLIAGFIVGGNGPVGTHIVVRALGPSLAAFGITNPLPDPVIELRDSSGALIASNNDWQDSQAAAVTASGLQPSDPRESAIVTTLHGGAFTAILGSATGAPGTALVEVYSVP